MVVETVVTADGDHRVTGDGYAPEGRTTREDAEVEPGPVLAELGLVARLSNGAALRANAGRTDDASDVQDPAASEGWRVEGDPMEGAWRWRASWASLTKPPEGARHDPVRRAIATWRCCTTTTAGARSC